MKHSNNTITQDLSVTAAAVCLALFQAQAFGAPGTLADQPLYVGTAVDPNIFILSDDSRSMDWDTLTLDRARDSRFADNQPDGSDVAAAGSVKHRDDDNDGTADCSFGSGNRDGYMYIVDFESNDLHTESNNCNVADDESWRARNSDFNPIYFDPTKDYAPWGGVDNSGTPYTDITITNAPDDPYNPGDYIDLTRNTSGRDSSGNFRTSDRDGDGQLDGFRFYTWTDDGDGIFENGEETEYQIGKVTDGQAAAWGKTAAQVKQNFANWFSYHRKREFVAKYAFSSAIEDMTGVRIGYGSINNNNNNNIAIASMNLDPAVGNKRSLLNKLFQTNSDNSTPIKQNFEKVGKYFDYANGSFFGDTGSYTNPILPSSEGGACQKNFSVLMTDGYYNDASFNAAVNNADKDVPGVGSNIYDGPPYEDNYSDTLADIAMHYYKTDLDTGKANNVPASGLDIAPHQHMTTYSVAFGVLGTLDTSIDPSDAGFAGWTDPNTSNATKIDDLWHAAYNGRGAFFSAQNPETLSTAIATALASASKGTSSAAAVAFNTTALDTGSVVYQALFNPAEDWKGELTSSALAADGSIASTPTWNAGDELTSSDNASRIVWTYRKDTTTGLAFKTLADLSATQQADLNMGPSAADGQGQARIDYLRGSNANESQGLLFRNRTNVLGDIVHSNPVYVGEPQSNHPDADPFGSAAARYSTFKSAYEDRDGIVYVGANDGMLHGFREADGSEAIAYVPNAVYSSASGKGLHYLTDPSYSHRYYVDLSPTVADVYLNSTAWKTVLVGGLRAGGRGIFALDVTYRTSAAASNTFTDANAASKVLWEFDSSDDADLGYTFAKPTIAMMENDKWAVIFGNGYNSTGDGQASLFIVYIDGGLDGTWSASDYIEIKTGVGTAGSPNGLSTPAVVDTDGNGQADRAYAGDLEGNLWAFDLNATNSNSWKVAYKTGSTPKPLFTAQANQAITSKPIVALQTATVAGSPGSPNLMVFFGTGQYIVNGDISTTDTQSFYGVWDEGDQELTISDLTNQALNQSGAIRTTNDPATAIPYDSANNANKGWYHDLPTGGERVVVNPKIRGNFVFYNTLIPDTDPCKPEGYGWLMAVKQTDGAMSDTPVFDIDGDGDIDADDVQVAGIKLDDIPAGSNFLGDVMYTPDDEGNVDARKIDAGISEDSGRLSWQELVNE